MENTFAYLVALMILAGDPLPEKPEHILDISPEKTKARTNAGPKEKPKSEL